ncbi:stage II sporulation protein M, partial [bacterium]|nr:stage II sporulation protein M [bacterium]
MNLTKDISRESMFWLKKWSIQLAFLFAFSIFLGYAAAESSLTEAREGFALIAEQISFLTEFSAVTLFLFILLNNGIKALLVMLLGTFFGIVPFLFIALNGYLIGFLSAVIVSDMGIPALIKGIL